MTNFLSLLRYSLHAMLLSSLAVCESWSQGRGPIQLENQYPLTESRLSLAPRSARTMGAGKHQVQLQLAVSNLSLYNGEEREELSDGSERIIPCLESDKSDCYSADQESRRTVLRYALGITDGFELGASLPLVWRGGGVLDPVIDGWHKAFGLPRGDRQRVEDGRSLVEGYTRDGTYAFEDGFGLGNLAIHFQNELAADNSRTTALNWTLSLPTAGDSYGHQDLDVMLSLLHEVYLGQSSLYGGFAVSASTDKHMSGIEYVTFRPEGFLTYEYAFTEAFSLLLGVQLAGAVIDNLPSHPDYSIYTDFGARFSLTGVEWQVLVRENPAPGNGTTDVTFMLGVGHTFSLS